MLTVAMLNLMRSLSLESSSKARRPRYRGPCVTPPGFQAMPGYHL